MSGSCHLNRASNLEIGVKCQIFVNVIFLTAAEFYNLGHIRRALTQNISVLVICISSRSDFCVGWKNQNKYSTLALSFEALSKWHEPDIIHK